MSAYLGDTLATFNSFVEKIEEETVTSTDTYKLTVSDAVLEKENWLIYNTSDSASGTSGVISFVFVKNKKADYGRLSSSSGSTPITTELNVSGNTIYFATNGYTANFGKNVQYTIMTW